MKPLAVAILIPLFLPIRVLCQIGCPTFTADFSFSQNICAPLQVQFAGESQPGVNYSWVIDGITYAAPGPGNATLTHSFAAFGNYPISLTATVGGCNSTITKTIAVQVVRADLIQSQDTAICAGASVQLKTKQTLDFCWSPATGLSDISSPNPIASPTVTTKYFFAAKTTGANLITNGDFESGNTGFTSVYSYTPDGFPTGVYWVGTDPHTWNANAPVSCGDHTSGHGNMMIVNGATTTGVNVWTTGPIPVTPNTNYAFSIWIQSVSPLAPAILQFSINGAPLGNTVFASATTCLWNQFYTTWNSGSSTTATIALVNNNTILSGNDFALDDISFAPVSLLMDSVTIDVETPSVSVSPAVSTVCPGTPVQLQASGSLNYSWSPATGLSDAGVASPIALPAAGTHTSYTVTGTSARGCVATATADLAVYPGLLTIGPGTLICQGDAVQLHASGANTYNWSPAGAVDDPFSGDPVTRPDTSTQFVVAAIDANGCSEKDSLTIRVKPVPVFKAPPGERVCVGFGVPLKSSNPAGYRYDWSPVATLNDPSAPAPIASPDVNTSYTLHISDSVCPAYDSSFTVDVTVLSSPVIAAVKGNDIDCAIHLAPLHATGGISYAWTPAAGLSDPQSPDPIASIDSTTTYIVKGTGLNGCYAYDTLTVNVTATGANTFVVPNAFTPNGDGHNDCFGVRRWGDVQLTQMEIFDRWGVRVFSTRNPGDCWDGSYNGRQQQAAAYVYVIRAHTFCGEVTRTGIVMLIR